MKRHEWGHLGVLLLAAIGIRYILFPLVGIWGDAGFYYYDAKLINQGLVPYVDFIGRSPLFNYGFASVASVFGNTMSTLRTFIVVGWLLTGFPVYYIAREIHSHHAGLVAFALAELSPFVVVYGYWANTQAWAVLPAMCGLALIVWRENWRTYTLSGVLFGLAFLSRRSMITVMAGLAVWMGVDWLRGNTTLRANWWRGVAYLAGFTTTLALAYVTLASGDVALAAKFAEVHGYGLFASSGRGGFPLIMDESPPPRDFRVDKGYIPIFNDLCQRCGSWTARTFAKTALVATPLIAPLFAYFRDWTNRWFSERQWEYTSGILLILAAYGAVTAIQAGFYLRAVTALAYLLVVYALYQYKPVGVLYDRTMLLPFLASVLLAVGYLYRKRVIHTYYWMDFAPFVAILSGVILVEVWHEA